MKRLHALWVDETGGFLNSAELIFLSALLVIGIIPGISSLRDAILTELCDMAAAVDHIAPPFNHPPGQPMQPIDGPDGGTGNGNNIQVCSDHF